MLVGRKHDSRHLTLTHMHSVTILARVLTEGLSPQVARHFLKLGFNASSDEARMHDLATRNQADALFF